MESFSKPKSLVLSDCSPVLLPNNNRHGDDTKTLPSVDKRMLIIIIIIIICIYFLTKGYVSNQTLW